MALLIDSAPISSVDTRGYIGYLGGGGGCLDRPRGIIFR